VKRVKIILYFGFVLIVLLVFLNHRLLHYAYIQAKGQLKIVSNTVPVEDLLKDPGFPDSLKVKLRWIREVKHFAVEDLGLKGIKNYTTYYDQEGKELMWVVSACNPFELKSFEWHFPLIGSFSYKGFFRYDMAVKERNKLQEEGYDAQIRTAGGWSTLGILKDPVLSNMLERDSGALADLIIHELTHGTIFIKDSIEFNENLASFIGNEGARIYLARKYGESSGLLTRYNRKVEDQEQFRAYVLKGAATLDSLYRSFGKDMPFERKLALKKKAIADFMLEIEGLSFHDREYYDYFEDFTPDNTFFMSFLRYVGGQTKFKEAYKTEFQGNLPEFIASMKAQYAR